MNKFGEFLYTLRKEKSMTQSDLADRLNITNKAVSKWETGESYPETSQLAPLSNILGVSIDELLKGERNGNKVDNKHDENKLKPFNANEGTAIATGVALSLVGLIVMIVINTLTDYESIGVSVLLIFVSIAVSIFVITALRHTLKSADLTDTVYRKGMNITIMLSIGVSIAILAVSLLIFLDNYFNNEAITLSGFFLLIIIAVFLIITNGIKWGNFVKEYNLPTDDNIVKSNKWGNFVKEYNLPTDDNIVKSKKSKISDALCGAIMLLATAVFLILGLVYNMWHPGWVVFPVGGILCGIVSTIVDSVTKN